MTDRLYKITRALYWLTAFSLLVNSANLGLLLYTRARLVEIRTELQRSSEQLDSLNRLTR